MKPSPIKTPSLDMIMLSALSEIYFSKRRWVLLFDAFPNKQGYYNIPLLLSERGDVVEMLRIHSKEFKLVSVRMWGGHRYRPGHARIYGHPPKDANFFKSPLFLGVLRRAKVTSKRIDIAEGDLVEINDEHCRFLNRYRCSGLEHGPFLGIVDRIDESRLYVRSRGVVSLFTMDEEAMSIDGFYTPKTAVNITNTLQRTLSALLAQPFADACRQLEEVGIYGFNNLKHSTPATPKKSPPALIECVRLMKQRIAGFMRDVDLTPKAIFSFIRVPK